MLHRHLEHASGVQRRAALTACLPARLPRAACLHGQSPRSSSTAAARPVHRALPYQRRVAARAALPPRPPSAEAYQSIDTGEYLDTRLEILTPTVNVEDVMLKGDVLTARPADKLQDIIPKLNKVSGLPVLDADGRVVGVISRKDIIRVRRAAGSLKETVNQHMTKPAVTVPPGTSVRDAAKVMLKRKVRRVPVVDKEGKPLGILSRTNIFQPLLEEAYDKVVQQEVAAMATGAGVRQTWDIKYLYDGDCAMCRTLKTVLERQDGRRGRIAFIDIADLDYDPYDHMGIEYDEAMDTIHSITKEGKVLLGTEALRALFDTVGLGWAVRLSEVPLFAKLLDVVYDFLSANRIALGGALDGLIAAKRMDMSKKGVETCGDVDEECEIEWLGGEDGEDDLAIKH